MNEDRVMGTAKNVGGQIQEGVGKVAGDAQLQGEGLWNQAEGTVQELYGQAKDKAETAASAVRSNAVTFEETLRNTIETRPYAAMVAALAIGWLIGRSANRV